MTVDPFPFADLVARYESSLLGQWEDLPTWETLQAYQKNLRAHGLELPADDAYRWLREGFLPVDPGGLFATSLAWSGARVWIGQDPDGGPWPHWATLDALHQDLAQWQKDSVTRMAVTLSSDLDRHLAPLWSNRPLVAGVVFDNCD